MAHRTCGLIYHAHQLEGIDEKTEVMLVRHIEEDSATKEWIGAIPTAADDEPKDVTTLEWIGAQREVITAKVRYVRMDAKGMRLHDQLPASWKVGEYRAFEVRDIPLTALKNNDPTLRRPFPPPVITDLLRPQGKTSPEEPGPDLARQLVETVSGLAEKVEALMQERATETRKGGEGPPAEKGDRKKLAFAEQPGGGNPEEQLRLADLIAAQGGAGKDRARGAAGANRAAEHSSDTADSDDDRSEKKEKKRRKKKEKKKEKRTKKESKAEKKKKDRSPSESPSSSGGESSDHSSSSDSRSRRSARRGGGASKMRAYDRKKKGARKHPMTRWRHLEKLAATAGYVGAAAVERYVGDTTKLGKSKATLYLASLLARCGERAAAGDAQGAAGTAASALMFFDMLHVYGDIEIAWLVALENDPMAAQKNPLLEKTLSVPDPAQTQNGKKGAPVRLKFSQLAEPETLEAALEVCMSWVGYDTLALGLQSA